MTTSAPRFPSRRLRDRLRVRLGHVAGLMPIPLAGVGGSASAVARRRASLRRLPVDPGAGTVARAVAVLDPVLGVALGAVAWFVLFLAALGSVRGPFHGLVDPGPYDHAWGGPTLAGAWLTHAGVWAPTLPVFAVLLVGLGVRRPRVGAPARRSALVVVAAAGPARQLVGAVL